MFETKGEKRWAIYTGILIMVITTVPYCIAYGLDSNMVFSGFLFGVEDGNSYIAKMLSGSAGDWLFRSPYTTFPQSGFLAFFPHILMGKLSSAPAQHDQLIFIFHFFRWVTGILLTITTYLFCCMFLKDIRLRKIATIIALVGGGFGWVSLLGVGNSINSGQPLEFYSPETFGFLSLLGLPHLLAAKTFLLLGFIFLLKNDHTLKNRLAGGLCWLITGFFQPLTIVTGWAVLVCYLLLIIFQEFVRQRFSLHNLERLRPQIISAITMILISSPWVLYNYFSFKWDPYLSGWASQNLILSPPIWDYLLSFSIFLPFSLMGVWKSLRKSNEPNYALPAAFVLAFPFLAYAPFNLQRRLPDGIWLALVILALSLFDMNSRKKKLVIPQFFLIFSLITPVTILAGGMQTILHPSIPVYRPLSETRAFEYLDETATKGSVVLASYETSNALPAWVPVRVLVGLGPESVNFDEVSAQVNDFYFGRVSADEQMEFLEENSVDYVFYGPLEKNMGRWDPASAGYMRKVYDQDGYLIFLVSLADGTEKAK